jgi:hypothetical protein
MATSKKPPSHIGYRDNDNGQFERKDIAQKDPKNHTREHIPNPGHGDTKVPKK